MDEEELANTNFDEILTQLENRSVPNPEWLSEALRSLHELYKPFRYTAENTQDEISLCQVRAYYYISLTELYYNLHSKFFINLATAVYILEKCFSELNRSGIQTKFTQNLQSKADALATQINASERDLQNTDTQCRSEYHENSKYLLYFWKIPNENSNENSWLNFPNVERMKIMNLVFILEELLLRQSDNLEKFKYSVLLSKAYKCAKISTISTYYVEHAAKVFKNGMREISYKCVSDNRKKEIRKIIKETVCKKWNMTNTKNMISSQNALNNLEEIYIENKYIKYCFECFIKNCELLLKNNEMRNIQNKFEDILHGLGKMNSIENVPIVFQDDYYTLLRDNQQIIPFEQEREYLNNLKKICCNSLSKCVGTAKRELAFLKHLVSYLRSVEDCRHTLLKLKLLEYCEGHITIAEFVNIIIQLPEAYNDIMIQLPDVYQDNLVTLKASAYTMENINTLSCEKHIVSTLTAYITPVQLERRQISGRTVIYISGKLIILSEVLPDVLNLKDTDVEEVHFVGADILHIDENLYAAEWSGINILVVANVIRIYGNIIWDVSGKDGIAWEPNAANGSGPGSDGTDGEHGLDGQSGGNIHISASKIINSRNFTIKSVGGNGSNGQNGGNGQDGTNGVSLRKSQFLELFPKLKHSHFKVNADMLKTKKNILDMIVKTDRTIKWKNPCLCYGEHRYIDGVTADDCHITFSFYDSSIYRRDEMYLLYRGSVGQSGGKAGTAGTGGKEGFGGEIVVPCDSNIDIKIWQHSGDRGAEGKGGIAGRPGKNGWDIGYIHRDGFMFPIYKIIGEFEDCKLSLKRHTYRVNEDCVFCAYSKSNGEQSRYIEIRPKRNRCSGIARRDISINKHTQHKVVESVHKKTISHELIQNYERQIICESLDEDASILPNSQAFIDEIWEEETQQDEKEERFEIKRQACYENQNIYSIRKFIPNFEKVLFEHESAIQIIVEILNNSNANLETWLGLRSDEVYLNDLQTVYRLLLSKKKYLNNFREIHKICILKYKFAVLQYISETIHWSKSEEVFTPKNITCYLIKGATDLVATNCELGNLIDYFNNDNERNRVLVRKYAQNESLTFLLYSLKFFIAENSDVTEQCTDDVETFLKYLNELELKLLRLIQCYTTLYQNNNKSPLLQYILESKLKVEKNYNNKDNFQSILSLFYDYLLKHGVKKAAYREVVACAFNINVQIFEMDTANQIQIVDDHNPSANDTLYLLFEHEQYTEMKIDNSYLNLVCERKQKSVHYSKILHFTNGFFDIRQYNNFQQNCEISYQFDKDNICFECLKYSEEKLISKLTRYFPLNEAMLVQENLKKLTSAYVKNRNILCTLFHRFEIEGRHISTSELSCLVNTILKYLATDNNALGVFHWIISAHSQRTWLIELFLLELENRLKTSLTDVLSFRSRILQIKQRDIIILMFIKLYDKHDVVTLDSIKKCVNILSQITIKSSYVENLPLSKWQYRLKELFLQFKLSKLVHWEPNSLLRATYYLSCLEIISGNALVDKFLEIMQRYKTYVSSSDFLDLLSYFYTHENSFNENYLDNLSKCECVNILEEIRNCQDNTRDNRRFKVLSDIIRSSGHNSEEIKAILNKYWKPLVNTKQMEIKTNLEIQEWVEGFKRQYNQNTTNGTKERYIAKNIARIINMLSEAIHLKRKFWLRKTQKLALLLLLIHDHSSLAQIATGEGKSLIIVCAAIVKALCGETVDVVTSSSVLAVRDAKICADIYNLFGVNVAHNCSDDIHVRKDAYSSCQVIYGDLANFQRDYLLDKFYEKNILGDRSHQNVFVDEVDNMFLDKGNNILYLSHDIFGMDKLESMYLFIWKYVSSPFNNVTNNTSVRDVKEAVFRDLFGSITKSDLKTKLDVSTPGLNVIYSWLLQQNVIDEDGKCMQYLNTTILESLPNHLKHISDRLSFVIEKTMDRIKEIRIPRCLHSFVKRNIDAWIKNAILAYLMEEGQDYVVDVDRTMNKADINPNIIIIDKGTGTDQSNSQWERALHQFLQLKHGCKVSPQNLKSVFISNVSYFNMYKKLFGLTGTLGSQVERDLLKELYDVHFISIPTAKPKQFVEWEPIVCKTKTHWLQEIVRSSQGMLRWRSVLVVCESIQDVDVLYGAFQQANINGCLVYKRAHEQCDIAQGYRKLDPGCVIIATNLAGRGTDIKINEQLDNQGGLHVIVAYFPVNSRIEQQAFGRAARCGCAGSGQLIFISTDSMMHLRTERDENELRRIADIKTFYDTTIKKEEILFKMFTQTYHKIKKTVRVEGKLKVVLQRSLDRWAFWLDECNTKFLNDESHNSCILFLKNLESESRNWQTWQEDPIQLTLLGLYYHGEKDFSKAINIFNFVIENEPQFSEAAHYYKAAALCSIIDFETKREENSKYIEQRAQLEKELLHAEKLFQEHSEAYSIAAAFVEHMQQSRKNSFIQIEAYKNQQQQRIQIYDVYIDSIHAFLGYAVSFDDLQIAEIDFDTSKNIYNDMVKEDILTSPNVKAVCSEDIKDIAAFYGLTPKYLEHSMNELQGRFKNENKFLLKLMEHIRLPSAEEFWDILLKENILKNEVKFIKIDKSKISGDINLLNDLPKISINLKKNDNTHVFLKLCSNCNEDDCFDKTAFLEKVGEAKYKQFKQNDALVVNKMAEYANQEFTDYFSLYDSLVLEDFNADGISNVDAARLLTELTNKNILKEDENGIFRLLAEYNNVTVTDMNPYQESVDRIIKIRFSYRTALQMLQNDLRNSVTPAFIRLPSRPHLDLMWDLANKKIITQSFVNNKNKFDDINAKVAKLVNINRNYLGIGQILLNTDLKNLTNTTQLYSEFKAYNSNRESNNKIITSIINLLRQRASPLDKLTVPDCNLVCLRNCIENRRISPLELHTFTASALSFVIKFEEKKWTFQVKRDVSILLGIGILEIVAGILVTLFTAGAVVNVGAHLISEGVCDIIYSITAWKSGYFSWKHYAKQKMLSAAVSTLIGGLTYMVSTANVTSRFGSKLLQKGVTELKTKDVAKMTGFELIQNASSFNVAYAVRTEMIQVSCEGIAKSFICIGIDYAMEKYLQGICDKIYVQVIRTIENVLREHPQILDTLKKIFYSLGSEVAYKFVEHIAKTYFTELPNNIMSVVDALAVPLSTFFCKLTLEYAENHKETIDAIVKKAFDFCKFITLLEKIVKNTYSFLNDVNKEICNELIRKPTISMDDHTPDKIKSFQKDAIELWKKELFSNVPFIIEEKITKPVLRTIATGIKKFVRKKANQYYNSFTDNYRKDQFNKKKIHFQKQLKENEGSVPLEMNTLLNTERQKAMMELRAKTRSANMFADSVLEDGPMDSVCLEACVKAIPKLLDERGYKQEPMKIIVTSESNVKQEFKTSSGEAVHVINLHIKSNCFSNSGKNSDASSGFDSLYCALLPDWPDLSEITLNEFRRTLSDTIRSDPNIFNIIRNGHHQLLHTGFEHMQTSLNNVCSDVITGESSDSHSSVTEYTKHKVRYFNFDKILPPEKQQYESVIANAISEKLKINEEFDVCIKARDAESLLSYDRLSTNMDNNRYQIRKRSNSLH